jgi:[ribosomal protein S5]-alanine N-acetyltransferase
VALVELVELDHADGWPLWRAARLAALADAPDAFPHALAERADDGEARWRERLLDTTALKVVAVRDGAPVGLVRGGVEDGCAWLYSLWVSPRVRDHGLGDQLVAAVEEWAARQGATCIRLGVVPGNAPAIALYRRHGYVDTAVPGEPLPGGDRELVMEKSSRVTLRLLTGADQDEFLRLATASAALHHPWMSLPATPQEFRAYLARFDHVTAEGLLICLRGTGTIAGVVNINSIIRGRFQNGSLSYAAFAATAGQGYMAEGLGLVLRYAFEQLRLHRLEAQIQPGNHASVRLVQRLGFRDEGYSPRLLFIDGAWRGHERWAITSDMIDVVPTGPHPGLPPR